MQIRDYARPEDRAAIGALVRDTGYFNEEEVAIAVELVGAHLEQGAASGYELVVADRGDGVVGYTCFGRISGTASSYDLYWIVVARGAQGAGLGRALMGHTEARIRGSGGRRVYVETSGRLQYLPTRRFYERAGYALAAVFPDFYADGDDKHVLVKVLRAPEPSAP